MPFKPTRRACLLAVVLLAGCGVPAQRGEAPAPPQDRAVAVASREYAVTSAPDQEREDLFLSLLSAAADRAAREAGHDTGFTYTLKPAGAVYPLSKAEISCLVRGRYADSRGRAACAAFFGDLEKRLKAGGF